jgi:hypothetical protein
LICRSATRLSPVVVAVVVCAAIAASCSNEALESQQCFDESGALYEQRIKPLLETDRPKSCNQCHLSGIDLSLFVRDTMCETRACLIENGLLDTNNVDNSLILTWISRAQPESELITQEVIDEEYQGFREFLELLASCGTAACQSSCGASQGPGSCPRKLEPLDTTATEASTPCDGLSIEQAFLENVFPWRDRCYPCHHTDQLKADPAAPRWIEVEGPCEAAAVITLRNVIDGGYIDTGDPTQSLLLLKPLAEAYGGVEHGGTDKFHSTDDRAYSSFLSFAEYYAACAGAGTTY